MTEQYDPKDRYDVIDPEGIKVGELEGLNLTRNDPQGELTQCQLVRQE